jgi:hypothetical protein
MSDSKSTKDNKNKSKRGGNTNGALPKKETSNDAPNPL